MTNKHLHIVSFDVPYPANYGGAIDVFYRIKALADLGVKITLHCFEYGRGQQSELDNYCEKVIYYERKKKLIDGFSKLPFIVKSRKSEALISNLLHDDSPILFEGLHTCFYLDDERLKDRIKIVRTHNIEHEYYNELARQSSGLKKQYFVREAEKLKQFEAQLKNANHILAIKESDRKHFESYCSTVHVLPASIPKLKPDHYKETSAYCLFHGNLSVAENDNGAKWLIEKVFSSLDRKYRFKIAGNDPSDSLIALCQKEDIELIIAPDSKEMDALINDARIHVFYTDQATGVKLKLLNAMASSGHVFVNDKMVEGTNLGDFCTAIKDAESFKTNIENHLEIPLEENQYKQRMNFLSTHFNTVENCKLILNLL